MIRAQCTAVYAQNPLDSFPRSFPVDKNVANLSKSCCGLTMTTDLLVTRQTIQDSLSFR